MKLQNCDLWLNCKMNVTGVQTLAILILRMISDGYTSNLGFMDNWNCLWCNLSGIPLFITSLSLLETLNTQPCSCWLQITMTELFLCIPISIYLSFTMSWGVRKNRYIYILGCGLSHDFKRRTFDHIFHINISKAYVMCRSSSCTMIDW